MMYYYNGNKNEKIGFAFLLLGIIMLLVGSIIGAIICAVLFIYFICKQIEAVNQFEKEHDIRLVYKENRELGLDDYTSLYNAAISCCPNSEFCIILHEYMMCKQVIERFNLPPCLQSGRHEYKKIEKLKKDIEIERKKYGL